MLQYLPEKELLNRIADGDETAFAMLFKIYAPKLHGFLISRIKTEVNAQELVQQTFLRIWLNREKLVDVENPNAWIFKVAANECYKFIRSQLVSKKALSLAGNMGEETDCQDNDPHFVQYKELKKNIEAAINSLPEQRKKIYILHRQHGMKIAEIAKALNISPKTVKNTLAASLKTIRTYLHKHGYVIVIFILKFLFHR